MSARNCAAARVLRPCRKMPPRWYCFTAEVTMVGLSTSPPIIMSWPTCCSIGIDARGAPTQSPGANDARAEPDGENGADEPGPVERPDAVADVGVLDPVARMATQTPAVSATAANTA